MVEDDALLLGLSRGTEWTTHVITIFLWGPHRLSQRFASGVQSSAFLDEAVALALQYDEVA